jgi:hypothetical protein
VNRREIEAQPSGFGVAQVTVENAVDVELGLDKIPLAMETLVSLAGRGGVAPFPKTKFHTKRPHPMTGVLTDCVVDLLPMIQKLEGLGLIQAEIPNLASAEHGYANALLRLTDKGRNVVEAYSHKRIRVGEVKNITVGQAIEDGKAAIAEDTRIVS